MMTILRYYLRNSRGQILAWGIGLALLGAYLMQFYDTMLAQQSALEQLLRGYPPELFAFFGGVADMFTPSGYLDTYFFSYMPIVLGIFAVLAGSGLLASDEESGTLDLTLAHPISRTGLFLGRLTGYGVVAVFILLITWLGFAAVLPGTSIGFNLVELALPFISLFAFLLFFGTLALLLSMLLPARRLAAMAAALILVTSYFITSLERVDETLSPVAVFSPLSYFQGGSAVNGLNWNWLGILLGFSALFALLAWWRFQRRDIRVGGEGGWGMPVLRSKQA